MKRGEGERAKERTEKSQIDKKTMKTAAKPTVSYFLLYSSFFFFLFLLPPLSFLVAVNHTKKTTKERERERR